MYFSVKVLSFSGLSYLVLILIQMLQKLCFAQRGQLWLEILYGSQAIRANSSEGQRPVALILSRFFLVGLILHQLTTVKHN